jgi:hypothetical protein
MRRALPVLALLFLVTACTKPSPGISVVSGTTTEHRGAVCWTYDKPRLEPGMCTQDAVTAAVSGESAARIPISPGQTVGISVDPIVADAGWTPVIGNQPLSSTPLRSLYFRFALPELQPVPAEGLDLQIIAGQGDQPKGYWVFKLTPPA